MVIRRFMPDNPARRLQPSILPWGAPFLKRKAYRMTSEERRKRRYHRRILRRATAKAQRIADYDSFDKVFTFDHLYAAYREARKGVTWKASTQRYISQAPLRIEATRHELMDGTFRSTGFYEFDLIERGKPRHIRSVSFNERVVQRCLCDNALVPVLKRTFIYDNGAYLSRKGYHFAIRRLQAHLRKYYSVYGANGYILLFDFSKFFDRVSHRLIEGILRKQFTDERIISLVLYFVDAFGEVGLGLGSQVSQILALASANRLDHFVKETLRIRYYGRYMDDGYLIHSDKRYLQTCLARIRFICSELGIVLNEKKTRIVKLSHGFSYLKVRFFLLPSGRIIRKLAPYSTTRIRRRLKKLRAFVENGLLCMDDLRASWQSWRAYAQNFNSHRSVRAIDKLYARQIQILNEGGYL